MTLLKINVIEEDFLFGITNNPQKCPIALAINRELEKINKNLYSIVTYQEISFHHREKTSVFFKSFELNDFFSNKILTIDQKKILIHLVLV